MKTSSEALAEFRSGFDGKCCHVSRRTTRNFARRNAIDLASELQFVNPLANIAGQRSRGKHRRLGGVREVESEPVALEQSNEFFKGFRETVKGIGGHGKL